MAVSLRDLVEHLIDREAHGPLFEPLEINGAERAWHRVRWRRRVLESPKREIRILRAISFSFRCRDIGVGLAFWCNQFTVAVRQVVERLGDQPLSCLFFCGGALLPIKFFIAAYCFDFLSEKLTEEGCDRQKVIYESMRLLLVFAGFVSREDLVAGARYRLIEELADAIAGRALIAFRVFGPRGKHLTDRSLSNPAGLVGL